MKSEPLFTLLLSRYKSSEAAGVPKREVGTGDPVRATSLSPPALPGLWQSRGRGGWGIHRDVGWVRRAAASLGWVPTVSFRDFLEFPALVAQAAARSSGGC